MEVDLREKAIKKEVENRCISEGEVRRLIYELALRVPEDSVSHSELQFECIRLQQQIESIKRMEFFDARMGQVDAQLGDIVGNAETLYRELRDEEHARVLLEEWIVEKVASIECQLKESSEKRSTRTNEEICPDERSPPPIEAMSCEPKVAEPSAISPADHGPEGTSYLADLSEHDLRFRVNTGEAADGSVNS
jgi:hypothetical protein